MTMFSVLEAYCRLLHYNNIRVMMMMMMMMWRQHAVIDHSITVHRHQFHYNIITRFCWLSTWVVCL